MIPDNRITFQAPRIDFDNDVGLTGTDIDSFPAAGSQARYDHMRSALLGLLSQQASFDEPSIRTDGTPWFDLNSLSLKIWKDNEWQLYSAAIPLVIDETDGTATTLADWYSEVNDSLTTLAPQIVFSGTCSADDIDNIPIPESLRSGLFDDSRPFVYINGLCIDPRNTRLEPSATPTAVRLSNVTLNTDDVFTVQIHRIPSTTFYSTSVSVP